MYMWGEVGWKKKTNKWKWGVGGWGGGGGGGGGYEKKEEEKRYYLGYMEDLKT